MQHPGQSQFLPVPVKTYAIIPYPEAIGPALSRELLHLRQFLNPLPSWGFLECQTPDSLIIPGSFTGFL
jgi:hypothetical protein